MPCHFVVVVQQKELSFDDQSAHRVTKQEQLQAELTAATSRQGCPASDCKSMWQPGGGCVVFAPDASTHVACCGTSLCVFQGTLSNLADLATTYGPVLEDEPCPKPEALGPAELLCHMYTKVGMDLLGQLRGAFAFVLYESKMTRVLAARDGSGRSPLWEARTTSDNLILASTPTLLEGCHEQTEFAPGDFKYGWHATPRRYQPTEGQKLSRRSLDSHGHAPHHVPHHGVVPAGTAVRRLSGSGGTPTPAAAHAAPQSAGQRSKPSSRRASLDQGHGHGSNGAHHHTMHVVAAEGENGHAQGGHGHGRPRRNSDQHGNSSGAAKAHTNGAPGKQNQGHHHHPPQQQPRNNGRAPAERRRSVDHQNWRLGDADGQQHATGGHKVASGQHVSGNGAHAASKPLDVNAPEFVPRWVATSSIAVAAGGDAAAGGHSSA